jgi:hypothetical protein
MRGRLPWWLVVILGWLLIVGVIVLVLVIGVSSGTTLFGPSLVLGLVAWTIIVVMLPGLANSHQNWCRRLLEWGPLVFYILIALLGQEIQW